MQEISSNAHPSSSRRQSFSRSLVLLILSTAEDISGGEIFLLSLVEKMQGWTPVVATPNPELVRRCRNLGVQAVRVRGLRSLYREHCFGCILASLFLPISRPPETVFAGHSVPRQCHHGCFFFGGALRFCSFPTLESTCSLVPSASGSESPGFKFPNCVLAAREGRHVSRRLLEGGRSKPRISGQEEHRCDHE